MQAQVADALARHKVHVLGWRCGNFSVHLNEHGAVSVLDDLPAGWALIHWPSGETTADYATSETTAFHWTVAHASAREVLNRPGLDTPFVTALDWQSVPDDSARCGELAGNFVYLRGHTVVCFEGRPLLDGGGQSLARMVSRILGVSPWLAHGRWAIDTMGGVTVTHLWPWCEPARLVAVLDANDGVG